MSFRHIRFLLLLVPALSTLAGCSQFRLEAGKFMDHLQTLQQNSEKQQATAESESAPKTSQSKTETPPKKLANIRQITAMLDDGKFEEARHQLTFYVREHPDDVAAKSFLHQVSVDPKKELGPPARKYRVKSGDTLGGIAARYLGNPMEFVILARYNNIRRSRDLKVGQLLSLPAASGKGSKPDTPETTAVPAEQPEQEQTNTETKPPAVDNSASSAPGVTDAQRQQARTLQASGMKKLRAHNEEGAYRDLKQALAINPDLEPARMTADRLQTKLVRKYHEQALAAYRDQNLNQAIDLWDKALAIDPNYEPAQGYRARALELQRRLQQLEKKKSDEANP